ncbi:MAG: hypothetical protein PVH88_11575 [Ignavibacteria bacterium]|jgi:hypothetical protein
MSEVTFPVTVENDRITGKDIEIWSGLDPDKKTIHSDSPHNTGSVNVSGSSNKFDVEILDVKPGIPIKITLTGNSCAGNYILTFNLSEVEIDKGYPPSNEEPKINVTVGDDPPEEEK